MQLPVGNFLSANLWLDMISAFEIVDAITKESGKKQAEHKIYQKFKCQEDS